MPTRTCCRSPRRRKPDAARTTSAPFVRQAQPYVGDDVQPLAKNLHKAAPELTTSFLELNRFVNMLAFNPKGQSNEHAKDPVSGAEPLTGNFAADRNRREGYLFWLHWVAANGNSVFSTRDANGPYRRVLLQLSCQGIQGLVDAYSAVIFEQLEAVAPPLTALTDQFTQVVLTLVFGQNPQEVISNPALCPS